MGDGNLNIRIIDDSSRATPQQAQAPSAQTQVDQHREEVQRRADVAQAGINQPGTPGAVAWSYGSEAEKRGLQNYMKHAPASPFKLPDFSEEPSKEQRAQIREKWKLIEALQKEFATPEEKFEEAMKPIDELFAAGEIGADIYHQKRMKVRAQSMEPSREEKIQQREAEKEAREKAREAQKVERERKREEARQESKDNKALESVRRLTETPEEAFQRMLAPMEELFQRGKITQEKFELAKKKLADSLDKGGDEVDSALLKLADVFGLSGLVKKFRQFKEVFDSLGVIGRRLFGGDRGVRGPGLASRAIGRGRDLFYRAREGVGKFLQRRDPMRPFNLLGSQGRGRRPLDAAPDDPARWTGPTSADPWAHRMRSFPYLTNSGGAGAAARGTAGAAARGAAGAGSLATGGAALGVTAGLAAGATTAAAAIGVMATSAVMAAQEFGPLTGAVAAVIPSVGLFGATAKKAIDWITEGLDEMAAYSPEAAMALAKTEISGIHGDMRRARRLGPHAARLEEIRQPIDSAVKDLWVEIKVLVAKVVESMEPLMDDILEFIKFTAEVIGMISENTAAIEYYTQFIVHMVPFAASLDELTELGKKFTKEWASDREAAKEVPEGIDPWTAMFMNDPNFGISSDVAMGARGGFASGGTLSF